MNYKYSIFNSIVPYQEIYALFNSFSGKVIFIEPALREILQKSIQNDVNELRQVHPAFYKHLYEEGFLVDERYDEVDAVKRLSKSIDEDESSFLLIINPTLNCNFQCWYCYESHIRGSRLSPEIIRRINAFITTTANRNEMKMLSISFFGGEPLLNFKRDNIPILEHFRKTFAVRDIDYSISYTTNGYLINGYFINYFTSNNLKCSFQITLDGCKDDHDNVRYVNNKKGSYDKIIENIKVLIHNKFPVTLRINYTAENIENIYKIAGNLTDIEVPLRKKYLVFDFQRVWQDKNKSVDIQNVLLRNVNIIRERGFDVVLRAYTPNNVVDSCYADRCNSAVINYNGDIFKCTARDFTKANREGFLNESGELVWENGNFERRMNAKFKNKSCLSCRILPLCNGGCSQHALEHYGKNYCIFSWDESEIDNVVTNKIEEMVNAHQATV